MTIPVPFLNFWHISLTFLTFCRLSVIFFLFFSSIVKGPAWRNLWRVAESVHLIHVQNTCSSCYYQTCFIHTRSLNSVPLLLGEQFNTEAKKKVPRSFSESFHCEIWFIKFFHHTMQYFFNEHLFSSSFSSCFPSKGKGNFSALSLSIINVVKVAPGILVS